MADAERGQRLFHIGGCANCHAKSPDGELGGGEDLITPAGVFRSPNISPDETYGIGGWSDLAFVNAMKYGVSPDGVHYYPAFPYTSYAKAEIADLLHLKAYLDQTPPVARAAPEHDLPVVFRFRFPLAIWTALFHDPRSLIPDPTQSEAWNRGRSIVDGLGHCGACHTPRNLFFARQAGRYLQGAAPIKPSHPPAPRLAGLPPDRIMNGLDLWSASISERSDMHAVTRAFSEDLPLSDSEDVAEYLSSLPTQ